MTSVLVTGGTGVLGRECMSSNPLGHSKGKRICIDKPNLSTLNVSHNSVPIQSINYPNVEGSQLWVVSLSFRDEVLRAKHHKIWAAKDSRATAYCAFQGRFAHQGN
jgi:hypothetical protein